MNLNVLIKRIEQLLIILVLVGQICCTKWYIPGVSAFPAAMLFLIALTVVAIFALWTHNNGMISVKEKFGPLAFLLIVNIALVSLANNKIDWGRIMLIICSFAFCLACTQAFGAKEEMERLLKWYVGLVFVSALVEIGQVFEIPFCIELSTASSAGDGIGNQVADAIESGRYPGLAGNSLSFAYNVSAALAISLFIKFKKANGLKKAVLLVVFLFAMFTNNTRSAMMSFFAVVAVWVFTKKRGSNRMEKMWKAMGTAAFAMVVILLLFDPSSLLEGTRFENVDSGTESRTAMILTAFNHAFHYPLGMGIYTVDPELVVGTTASTYHHVVENTAHNLLGNCAASYGFVGLGLMIGLYLWAFNVYRKKKKVAEDPTVYMIALSGLLALAINAFFHNSYILNGELSSFLFFAALYTPYTSKEITNTEGRRILR